MPKQKYAGEPSGEGASFDEEAPFYPQPPGAGPYSFGSDKPTPESPLALLFKAPLPLTAAGRNRKILADANVWSREALLPSSGPARGYGKPPAYRLPVRRTGYSGQDYRPACRC